MVPTPQPVGPPPLRPCMWHAQTHLCSVWRARWGITGGIPSHQAVRTGQCGVTPPAAPALEREQCGRSGTLPVSLGTLMLRLAYPQLSAGTPPSNSKAMWAMWSWTPRKPWKCLVSRLTDRCTPKRGLLCLCVSGTMRNMASGEVGSLSFLSFCVGRCQPLAH